MDGDAVRSNPNNAGILAYRWSGSGDLTVRSFDVSQIDYWGGGGHPDAAERLVDLTRSLGRDTVDAIDGLFTIAHHRTATILATIVGTAYVLRTAPILRAELHTADVSSTMRWSDGHITDLATTVGPDWIWGRWLDEEPRWLAETVRHFDDSTRG